MDAVNRPPLVGKLLYPLFLEIDSLQKQKMLGCFIESKLHSIPVFAIEDELITSKVN